MLEKRNVVNIAVWPTPPPQTKTVKHDRHHDIPISSYRGPSKHHIHTCHLPLCSLWKDHCQGKKNITKFLFLQIVKWEWALIVKSFSHSFSPHPYYSLPFPRRLWSWPASGRLDSSTCLQDEWMSEVYSLQGCIFGRPTGTDSSQFCIFQVPTLLLTDSTCRRNNEWDSILWAVSGKSFIFTSPGSITGKSWLQKFL